jgi:hypothetical protein
MIRCVSTPASYCDLFDQLERYDIRYVVVGGVAIVLHGYARPTADLDLVIDPEPVHAQRAMQALMIAGFVPTIFLPISALTVLRLLDRSHREVDLFLRYAVPFDELWQASERVPVNGSTVRISSVEHIIREKKINGRPQDLRDIETLLATTKPRGGASGGDAGERDSGDELPAEADV